MRLYRHTPALADPQTLVDALVGREDVLDALAGALGAASRGGSYSHSLLIGAKGMGKSHILRLVYYAVCGSIELPGFEHLDDAFTPVILAEEEYVSSLAKLLLTTLTYLAESGLPAPKIPADLLGAATLGDCERTAAIAYVDDFKAKSGRILLLLVDNINEILENMTEEDQGELRRMLMASDNILLIGAAPTLFDAVTDHDCPLYNFFETIWLRDLSFAQAQELLSKYARMDGRDDLLEEIAGRAPRIRSIHALTGGNPRLLLALYHIIAEDDVDSVETTLLRMLDELSPYFRERMRDLSPQQREIVDVLAQSSEQLSPTAIAKLARLRVQIVNAQLAKLENQGYVRKYIQRGRKQVLYGMSEMLFSWWRQMRVEAGRRRLGWIVRLLAGWFTPEEIEERVSGLETRLANSSGESEPSVTLALEYYNEARASLSDSAVRFDRVPVESTVADAQARVAADDTDARAWHDLSVLKLGQREFDAAAAALEKAWLLGQSTGAIPDDAFESDLAGSLNNLAAFYSELGRREDAPIPAERAVEIRERLAKRNPDAFEPDLAMSLNNLAISYSELGRREDALIPAERAVEIYERLVKRNPDAFEPDLAGSLNNLANRYSELRRREDALIPAERAVEIRERLVKRNPDAFEPDLAMSLNNLANRYAELGKDDDALAASRRALAMAANRTALLGIALGGATRQYSHLLQSDRASAREWLDELVRFCSATSDSAGTAGILVRHLSSLPISAVSEAAAAIRQDASEDMATTTGPFLAAVDYAVTDDPLYLDRLRPEERVFAEEVVRALRRQESDSGGG